MDEMKKFMQLIATDKTAGEQIICKAALHAILDGEAADRAGLAAAAGFLPEKVDAILDGLVSRGLVVVDPDCGRVVGSWGLSLVPTVHKLRIRGRDLYTWCAVDAVGIPAGLGEDALISSRCHHCNESVNIEIAAGHLSRAVPLSVQVWVTAGQAGRSIVGYT